MPDTWNQRQSDAFANDALERFLAQSDLSATL